MYKTTARLSAIADMLPKKDTIADIGCDHGLLCAQLLLSGKCNRVIAVDISSHAIEKTRSLAETLGLAERLETRLGSGLAAIRRGEVDAAAIAGLGGRLIASMIEDAKENADAIPLTLQPMQQVDDLRRYLRENGFMITDERMVKERGRIFEIMTVKAGKQEMPAGIPEELQDEIGPLLWKRGDPLLCERLRMKAAKLKGIAGKFEISEKAGDGLLNRAYILESAAAEAEKIGRRLMDR